MIVIKSTKEIEQMGILGGELARILLSLKNVAKAGIETLELDMIVKAEAEKIGARASSYGYHGFPGYSCISLNETVIHGIPSKRKILEGDMVSIDITLEREGVFVDSAITFVSGSPTKIQQKLIDVCKEALDIAISKAIPGNFIGDIGNAVQNFVESNGFSVIRDYVGHGVGRAIHEDPQIPNFGTKGTGAKIVPGMTLAIEPMIAEGTWRVRVERDGWTVNTHDGKLSCHFEHTIAITENGNTILTKI